MKGFYGQNKPKNQPDFRFVTGITCHWRKARLSARVNISNIERLR